MDEEVISSALKTNSESEARGLKLHIIYAGDYYLKHEEILRFVIRKGMKKYKLKSVMVTSINMWRQTITTKEFVEMIFQDNVARKGSVNDDLESFLEDLRLGEEPDEAVSTYYFPKLTEAELELVERKDKSYLRTFLKRNPQVTKSEMMLSETDSQFVYGLSRRKTFTIADSP